MNTLMRRLGRARRGLATAVLTGARAGSGEKSHAWEESRDCASRGSAEERRAGGAQITSVGYTAPSDDIRDAANTGAMALH
jgi:hypothetical protein